MAKKIDSLLRGYLKAPERMRKDPSFPIFELGYRQGRDEVRNVALTHLQNKYIHDADRPERDSPEARYLLKLASELVDLFRAIEPGTTVDN